MRSGARALHKADNTAEAPRWYRKAAEQGHAAAQFNLGSMYENGEGGLAKEAEAARWYRKAAEQNDDDAKKALVHAGEDVGEIVRPLLDSANASEARRAPHAPGARRGKPSRPTRPR
jgi:TPR repeat protein